jgi:aryl-alcohol dehydrogenase-like predicted oxidoreductase
VSLPTRPLGRSGLNITRVGFGSSAIGNGGGMFGWVSQGGAECRATLRRALDAGINWIDTTVYGLEQSEELVGRFMGELAASSRPLVFTHGGLVWNARERQPSPSRIVRAASIQRACEASLRRLNVERIDLYQFHWPGDDSAVEEPWTALTRLIEQGKVRALGLSNVEVGQLDRCEALRHVDALQPPFSLINRTAAEHELPWCASHDTGVICDSPMQSGLLTDSIADHGWGPAKDWRGLALEFRLRDALRPIAKRHGTSVSAIAIAWMLAWPGVTGAILGARTPAQLDGWIEAASIELAAEDLGGIAAAIRQTGAGSGPVAPWQRPALAPGAAQSGAAVRGAASPVRK